MPTGRLLIAGGLAKGGDALDARGHDTPLFLAIIGVLAVPLVFVLQANGAVDMGWKLSAGIYAILFFGILGAFWKWDKPLQWRWRIGLMATVAVSLGWLSLFATVKQFHKEHTLTPVLPTFRTAGIFRDSYTSQLGNPVGDAVAGDTYEAAHEHAMVLWVRPEHVFYQFPLNSDKWVEYTETFIGAGKIYQDKDLKRLFKTPAGLLPPYGGVAYQWLHQPEKWKWIGGRLWDCWFDENQIFTQRFDHGTMLGPLLLHPVNRATQILILLDNGTRRSREAAASPPACATPPLRN